MEIEEAKKECLRLLSDDGNIKFEKLALPEQLNWLAYEKGFLKAFEFLTEPIIEQHNVCNSCYTIGISDNNCVCTYQNGYKTKELNFPRCKVCNVIEDNPIY